MSDQSANPTARAAPKPGDIVAFETASGTRHVQVTHLRAPYPDVLRAIVPNGGSAPQEIATGRTAFIAMAELARAFAGGTEGARIVGHAPIPQEARAFPAFRLPIRNRAGEIVYWWMWDGDGLSIAPDADDTDLPIREVLPVDDLRRRLAGLGDVSG